METCPIVLELYWGIDPLDLSVWAERASDQYMFLYQHPQTHHWMIVNVAMHFKFFKLITSTEIINHTATSPALPFFL